MPRPFLLEFYQCDNVVINGVYGHVTTWHRAAWSTHADLKFHTRVNFAGNSSAGSVGDEALTRLGDTHHAAGELAQARQAWQQALAILEDLQHPDAGQVRAKLASTNDRTSPNSPA